MLKERDSDIGVIEGRFIRHQLKIYGEDVTKSSKKIMNSARTIDKKATLKQKKKVYKNGFTDIEWNSSYQVNENSLTYRIPMAQRFVDMRTRNTKGYTAGTRKIPKGKIKKQNHPVYNKPTMVHKKYLVKMLSFGFTEEVKEQFRALEDLTSDN